MFISPSLPVVISRPRNDGSEPHFLQHRSLLPLRAHAGFLVAVNFVLQVSEMQAHLFIGDLQLGAVLGLFPSPWCSVQAGLRADLLPL